MSLQNNIRWTLVGVLGKPVLWLWAKLSRMTILGKEDYQILKAQGKPVIILVWHGRIFIVPYFFRKRGIMPLISPSQDGEIAAQVMSRWGYKILRGSGSHSIIGPWNEMIQELRNGGEVLIVPDGPRGPNRKMKMGGLKLAQQTGAYLVPFSFSTSRKKILRSWDNFLMFMPFSKVVAIYGQPIAVNSNLKADEFEKENLRIEKLLVQLDDEADRYFD